MRSPSSRTRAAIVSEERRGGGSFVIDSWKAEREPEGGKAGRVSLPPLPFVFPLHRLLRAQEFERGGQRGEHHQQSAAYPERREEADALHALVVDEAQAEEAEEVGQRAR